MCEIISGSTYGYDSRAWEQAKSEAIRAIVRQADQSPILNWLVASAVSDSIRTIRACTIYSVRSRSKKMPAGREC